MLRDWRDAGGNGDCGTQRQEDPIAPNGRIKLGGDNQRQLAHIASEGISAGIG